MCIRDRAALDAVLYHLCEGMRFVSLMVEPVIPIAAEKIWAQLGLVDFEKANCIDLDILFIDFSTAFPLDNAWYSDGIHPNEKGYSRFAEIDVYKRQIQYYIFLAY